MAVADTSQVIQHLRRIVRPPDDGLTDGQLLERFLTDHEQDAFAALVRRHSRMVLGVCRRILKEPADADDAFQATFLILVRKAGGFLARLTIGDWLYGVAYHTALKARAAALRRREREKQAAPMSSQEPSLQDDRREALDLLDQELQHLPEKYRVPVVLCDLEERTHQEAATLLGCPPGTVSGRLSRARALLARRLRRHGLALSAGALAALLTENTASARVPSILVESTIQAATAGTISAPVAALTEGVLRAMLMNKIKLVAVVLLTLGFLGTGAGVLTHRALADKPSAPANEKEKPKEAVKEKPGEPSKEEATELSAVVQSVDADKNTMTVIGKPLGAKTFDVSKDAKVLLGGTGKGDFKEGKLSDLKAGVAVTLKLTADRKTVVGISASAPTVRGTVKAVDAFRRTVTVTFAGKKNDAGTEQTYEVAKDAPVAINDGKVRDKQTPAPERTLADVPVGSVVSLKLSLDQKVVSSIQADGPEVSGVVKAVDANKNTLTVDSKAGERTFTIAADVPISFGGGKDKKAAPEAHNLADVPVGALVAVQLSPDQQSVLSVRADGANIDGTVKALDAGKGQLTIAVTGNKGEAGADRTVVVPADADLRIDGKNGKLGDVPVGALVSVRLRPDQKAVLSLVAEGTSIGGTLKALDADKRRITVAGGGGKKGEIGEERSFDISPDVVVRIDGKEAKLAEVPVSSVVRLKLAVDQKTVKDIDAGGRFMQGTVKGVDVANANITLTDDAGEQVLTVAKESPIVVDGKAVKLSEVPVEAMVGVKLAADQRTVLSLTAEGPTYKGTVKAVDAGKRLTVSVQVGKNDFEEKTFDVSKDVQVVTGINGVAVQIADVKADKEVVIRLSADRKAVLRVTLVGE